jgi:hypothetical protein
MFISIITSSAVEQAQVSSDGGSGGAGAVGGAGGDGCWRLAAFLRHPLPAQATQSFARGHRDDAEQDDAGHHRGT